MRSGELCFSTHTYTRSDADPQPCYPVLAVDNILPYGVRDGTGMLNCSSLTHVQLTVAPSQPQWRPLQPQRPLLHTYPCPFFRAQQESSSPSAS
jgi:hypothetical protein